jgi:hypothetical protein
MNKTDTPENSLFPSQDKDTKYIAQFKRINEYFKNKTASRFMAAVENDIPIQNVCRYADNLLKSANMAVVKKDRCAISKRLVQFLSTNPALFPRSNQLNLFGHEDE